jgi:hypothetical protein
MGEATEKQLMSLSSSHILAIEKAGKEGAGLLIDVNTLAKQQMEDTVNSVRNEVRNTIRKELVPYHDVLELIPRMQSFTAHGYDLLNVPMDRKIANRVPLAFVSLMANSIDEWVKEMMPETIVTSPKDLTIAAYMSSVAVSCRLTAVSSWLRNELVNKILQC